ncbi:MAG: cytochrome P450, partial [Candidatus Tectomicrobia bacterium]|nr:cytochrome P450 [Candidatus Tectomicrobia bacterium]
VREPEAEEDLPVKAFLDRTVGIRRKRPPMMPGALPLIGHSLRLRPIPTKTLAGSYRALGPVFRVRDLTGELTVLAGPEANLFCQKHGRRLFRSQGIYAPLSEGMDAQRIILSMDGEEHFVLRRAISSHFSRDRFMGKLPEIRDIILGELPENGKAVAINTFSQLTAKSIGLACTGYLMSSGQVDNMDFFLRRLIAGTVLKVLPRFMLRSRRTRQAKAGFFEIFTSMLRARLANVDSERDANLVETLLDLHRSNPQFLPEHELRVTCLGPIFAGLHTTGSTGAFAMYLLLKNPEIMNRIRAEADLLFADEGPTPEKMDALDITKRVVLETLRIYNPFNSVFRHAANTFEFGGYTIPAGTRLFLPTAVPHYCSEFFPEPERFDIDRYLPKRAEHRQGGAYMPFGFGTHRCLGGGIAEAHLMFSLATILHYRDVAMDPPNHKLKIIFDGVPAPTRKFKLEFVRRQSNPARASVTAA